MGTSIRAGEHHQSLFSFTFSIFLQRWVLGLYALGQLLLKSSRFWWPVVNSILGLESRVPVWFPVWVKFCLSHRPHRFQIPELNKGGITMELPSSLITGYAGASRKSPTGVLWETPNQRLSIGQFLHTPDTGEVMYWEKRSPSWLDVPGSMILSWSIIETDFHPISPFFLPVRK